MSVYDGKVPKGTRNARTGFPVGQTSAPRSGGSKPPQRGTCVCMVVVSVGGLLSVMYRGAATYAGEVVTAAARLRGLA